jgi:hypothetical protein
MADNEERQKPRARNNFFISILIYFFSWSKIIYLINNTIA